MYGFIFIYISIPQNHPVQTYSFNLPKKFVIYNRKIYCLTVSVLMILKVIWFIFLVSVISRVENIFSFILEYNEMAIILSSGLLLYIQAYSILYCTEWYIVASLNLSERNWINFGDDLHLDFCVWSVEMFSKSLVIK